MKTIPVADDETKVRVMIARHLASAGYEVREASNGKEALLAVSHGGIDLVITDLHMPDMDGIELIARMSQDASAPKIIAISGGGHLDKQTVLEMASRLGAAQTLEKPFSGEQLLEIVEAELGPP